jgi:hypothetical protein
MKKYLHLVSKDEWEAMKKEGRTWGWLAEHYRAPDWCGYPDAVDPLGCWSLIGLMVTGEDYCKTCDLYQPAQPQENG